MTSSDWARLSRQPLTYTEIGASDETPPEGYRHFRERRLLGTGDGCFRTAVETLFSWRLHRRAGVRVEASEPRVLPAVVAVLGVGIGPLRVRAPVRVVEFVWDDHVAGFAYGTLPGHPEIGEERFVVRREGEQVWGEISAFSRPGSLLTRVAGPVGRGVQDLITARYLRAFG